MLESQRPHHLSYQFNTGWRSSLEPVIFPDPTLSLILHWCRAVGNLYGVQVSSTTQQLFSLLYRMKRLWKKLYNPWNSGLLNCNLNCNYVAKKYIYTTDGTKNDYFLSQIFLYYTCRLNFFWNCPYPVRKLCRVSCYHAVRVTGKFSG